MIELRLGKNNATGERRIFAMRGSQCLGPIDLEDIERAGLGDASAAIAADSGFPQLSESDFAKVQEARADRLMPAALAMSTSGAAELDYARRARKFARVQGIVGGPEKVDRSHARLEELLREYGSEE